MLAPRPGRDPDRDSGDRHHGMPGVTLVSYLHIDETRVARLLREISDDVPAGVRFMTDFVGAWEGRVARLLDAADRRDAEDVITVLLSVRTASAMLGATALSSSASDLQRQVAGTRQVDAPAVRRFVEVGTASCLELLDLANRLEAAAA
jgi:hypothetical protein